MGIVTIENLKVGMVLDQEVRDRSGRLLLPVGGTLSEASIRVLKMWGIHELKVVGHNDTQPENSETLKYDQDILLEAESDLVPRFSCADRSHPMISELFRLLVFRKAEQLLLQKRKS